MHMYFFIACSIDQTGTTLRVEECGRERVPGAKVVDWLGGSIQTWYEASTSYRAVLLVKIG